MTKRERVRTALQHRQPDKTPYHIGFTQRARDRMARYCGDADFERHIDNHLRVLKAVPRDGWREVRPDLWRDQFGVEWDRSVDKDIGVVTRWQVTPDNLADFAFPNPDDPTRFEDYAGLRERYPDEFVVTNIGFSLFERAWTLAGMENLFVAMMADPDFAHGLLDRILDFNLRLIDHACDHDIDAVMFGDDWGQQQGLLMGIDLWREYIGPRVREMYAAVKRRGRFVFIHSCGKVEELFPDLIDSGLDIFNPLQPEVMDPAAMKAAFGDRLCFYGGISTQRTLPYATPAEVKEEVKRLLDVVGRDGGYIASPAHDIPPDAKPENIAAMLETLAEQ